MASLVLRGAGSGANAAAALTDCRTRWSDIDGVALRSSPANTWSCLKSESTQSSAATDTPVPSNTPIPAPGRASGLTAVLADSAVSPSWSAPADGGAVSGFRNWRRLPNQGETELSVLVSDTGSRATSFVDGDAVAGQKHIYRVQALGAGGEEMQSPPVEIVVSTNTPIPTATNTPTATATATPTPTDTPTNTPTPAPKLGCIQVGPTTYWLFPSSNFLSGTINVHNSDQCDSTSTTQDIGADGYVLSSAGQSAAETLCSAGHGNGLYQAQQQVFNTSL